MHAHKLACIFALCMVYIYPLKQDLFFGMTGITSESFFDNSIVEGGRF